MSRKSEPVAFPQSIVLWEDFPARTSQAPAQAKALLESAVACGLSLPGSSENSGPNGSSSRTSQAELFAGSTLSGTVWNSSAMKHYRSLCRQRMSALLISEDASLSLPTPSASSYGNNRGGAAGRVGKVRPSLESLARQGKLPTPTAGDAKASGSRQKKGSSAKPGVSLTDVVVHDRRINEKHGARLPTPAARDYKGPTQHRDPSHGPGLPNALGQTARTLSPLFVAWMMGFPLVWFDGVVEPEDAASWRSGIR